MTLIELVMALAAILGGLQAEGATRVLSLSVESFEDGSAHVGAEYAGPTCPYLAGEDACYVVVVRDAETRQWSAPETGP